MEDFMQKTKKQLIAERAQIESALLKIEEAEKKAERNTLRSERDEWCAAFLQVIENAPVSIELQGRDGDCLTMHLVSLRALLERLLAEDHDA
jgi:hypothetical protein